MLMYDLYTTRFRAFLPCTGIFADGLVLLKALYIIGDAASITAIRALLPLF